MSMGSRSSMRGGAISTGGARDSHPEARQELAEVHAQRRVLSVHALDAADVSSGAVRLTGASGRLSAPGLPPLAEAPDGAIYRNLVTCGDGACGLHALFGAPRQGLRTPTTGLVRRDLQSRNDAC